MKLIFAGQRFLLDMTICISVIIVCYGVRDTQIFVSTARNILTSQVSPILVFKKCGKNTLY